MAAAYAPLLSELDRAMARGTREQRTEALERVTRLFLSGAGQLQADQIALFDEVFERLTRTIEDRALAELARALAPVANAPARAIRRLAREGNIAIAGPVLKLSPRLDAEDLVVIARAQSQAHLFAIAGRRGIEEPVTDVLVRRGDREVVRNLAVNHEAKLSEAGYATIVKRAGQDAVLAVHAGCRPDIPSALFRRLVAQASTLVQSRLLAASGPERQAEIKRVVAKVGSQVGRAAYRDYRAAQERITAMRRSGGLTEHALFELAKSGEFECAAAALAALGGVSIDVVDRLMNGDKPDPVLVLCSALRLQGSTVAAVLSLRLGAGTHAMERALEQFDRLSPATTQRIVQFWRARPALEAASA